MLSFEKVCVFVSRLLFGAILSDAVLDWPEGSQETSDRDVILSHVNQKGCVPFQQRFTL